MRRDARAILIGVAIAMAAPASALPPLHEDRTVRGGFYAIGLADEVRRNCPTIAPRLIRAWTYLKSLERHAREAGYDDVAIEALLDNKAEKEKLRAEIRADLAARGARPGHPDGYCAVGREEIARGSAAGRLLRMN